MVGREELMRTRHVGACLRHMGLILEFMGQEGKEEEVEEAG